MSQIYNKRTDQHWFFLSAIFIFCSIPIPYLTGVFHLYAVYQMAQVLAFVFIVGMCITKYRLKSRISPYSIILVLYLFWLVLAALKNSASVGTILWMAVRLLTLLFLIEWGKRKHLFAIMSGYSFSLLILITCNTLSAIFFPNALYANAAGRYVCFLLGEDNASINIYLLTLCLCCLETFYQGKNISRKLLLAIGNLVLFSIVREIGGGIVCSSVFLVTYILYIIIRYRLSIWIVMISMMTFFVLFIIFQKISVFNNLIVNYLNRNITLSGRVYIWDRAVELFIKKPVMGYGSFYSADLAETIYQSRIKTVITPHNTYLSNLIAGGIVLLGFFIMLLYVTARQFDKYKDKRNIKTIVSIATLVMLLHGQIEGSDTEYIIIAFYFIYTVFEVGLTNEALPMQKKIKIKIKHYLNKKEK